MGRGQGTPDHAARTGPVGRERLGGRAKADTYTGGENGEPEPSDLNGDTVSDTQPREKIEGMKDQWKEIADGLIVDKLELLSEEDEEKLRDGVRKMQTGA